MTLKPTGEWIMAQKEARAEMSTGGIYLPETKKAEIERALVLDLGPEFEHEDIKLGDMLAILPVPEQYAKIVKSNGREYLFLKYEDVMAVEDLDDC